MYCCFTICSLSNYDILMLCLVNVLGHRLLRIVMSSPRTSVSLSHSNMTRVTCLPLATS